MTMETEMMLPIDVLKVITVGSAQPGTVLLPSARTGPGQLICGTSDSRNRVELAQGANGFQLLYDVSGSDPHLAISAFTTEADLKSIINPLRGGVPLGSLCLSAGPPLILVKARIGNALVGFKGEVAEEDRLDKMMIFTSWRLVVELPNGDRHSVVDVNVAAKKSTVELL